MINFFLQFFQGSTKTSIKEEEEETDSGQNRNMQENNSDSSDSKNKMQPEDAPESSVNGQTRNVEPPQTSAALKERSRPKKGANLCNNLGCVYIRL